MVKHAAIFLLESTASLMQLNAGELLEEAALVGANAQVLLPLST